MNKTESNPHNQLWDYRFFTRPKQNRHNGGFILVDAQGLAAPTLYHHYYDRHRPDVLILRFEPFLRVLRPLCPDQNKTATMAVLFWWTRRDSNPGPTD